MGHRTRLLRAPRIPTIGTNLAAIVARVHELTAGHRVLVVLLDYWSVWLGGQYATAKADTNVAAAARVTDEVNSVIKSTAAASGSAYVDLRAAFAGPNYTYDETHYLSNDGDHPSGVGHKQIAAATQAVVESAVRPLRARNPPSVSVCGSDVGGRLAPVRVRL